MLDKLFSGIKDIFSPSQDNPSGGGILGMDKEMAGMIGMAMLNRANPDNFLSPIYMLKMMGLSGDTTDQIEMGVTNPVPQGVNSVEQQNNMAGGQQQPVTTASLPQNMQERLSQLKSWAQSAYPDNPTMQQVAITQAIHESRLMGKPSQLASRYRSPVKLWNVCTGSAESSGGTATT